MTIPSRLTQEQVDQLRETVKDYWYNNAEQLAIIEAALDMYFASLTRPEAGTFARVIKALERNRDNLLADARMYHDTRCDKQEALERIRADQVQMDIDIIRVLATRQETSASEQGDQNAALANKPSSSESLQSWAKAAPEQNAAQQGTPSKTTGIREAIHGLGVGGENNHTPAAAAPEWVTVPMEPTDAMLDSAVAFALMVQINGEYRWTHYMRDLWKQMLAAALRQPRAGREWKS